MRAGMVAMSADYAPLSDMRGSNGYRLSTAQNLLYRFYLETRSANALPSVGVSVFA